MGGDAERRGVTSRGSAIAPPPHTPAATPEKESDEGGAGVKEKGDDDSGGESVTAMSVASLVVHAMERSSLGAGAAGRESKSAAEE